MYKIEYNSSTRVENFQLNYQEYAVDDIFKKISSAIKWGNFGRARMYFNALSDRNLTNEQESTRNELFNHFVSRKIFVQALNI